jgi:hypothetical protein
MFHSLEQIGDGLGPASERPESEGLKRAPAPSPDTSCCHTNICVYALSDTTCSNPSDTSSKPFGRARAAATGVSGGSYAATASQYTWFERIASKSLRHPGRCDGRMLLITSPILPSVVVCSPFGHVRQWSDHGLSSSPWSVASCFPMQRKHQASPWRIGPASDPRDISRSGNIHRLESIRTEARYLPCWVPRRPASEQMGTHLPQPVCHAPAGASSRAGRRSGTCQ